jgi:hypothetical protein
MQWPHAIYDLKDTVNESLPFSVIQASQRDAASEVAVIVCIATRTAQRTFLRYLDRQRGLIALQDLAPRSYNFGSFQFSRPLLKSPKCGWADSSPQFSG